MRALVRLVLTLGCLLAGAVLLAGCSSVDPGQADLCRQMLPALEPDGMVRVLSIQGEAQLAHVIRVAYQVEEPGDMPRGGLLRCAFGGGSFDEDRMKITGIEQDGQRIGDARQFFLERFWLGKPDAMREGEARLLGKMSFDPILPFKVSSDTGYFVQQMINALPVGAFYAFLAVAYALVYGLVGRINLSFGQLAVAGAYGAVAMTALVGNALTALSSQGVMLAALITLAAATLYGAVIGEVTGRAVFLPLMRAGSRSFLIASIGLGIVMAEVVHLVAGARVKWAQVILDNPIAVIGGGFEVTITVMRVFEVVGAVVVLGGLMVAMRRSDFGRRWRAIADDRQMARLLGIDVDSETLATIALASALAALGGAMMALHYGEASYEVGLAFGLKALVAAVLGGIGSLPGAALGGLIIGITETLWSAYLPNDQREIAIYAVLILVLIFKPSGLFGISDDGRSLPDRSEV
ncbi:branched-chain amino acid ABC transporter permease [Oryzibacter oryziterrae]|uniref:branched-chain amino acid ABC transporter permease n=1 Tax=Oryzibacter oryziterrae TaxID=2766474 RepID=UPI001F3BF121|nr:branched-chain amino acid ABC transporter permease [Oryzibacter oryziterrae]